MCAALLQTKLEGIREERGRMSSRVRPHQTSLAGGTTISTADLITWTDKLSLEDQ